MTSARWVLVERDFESASKHFLMATRVHRHTGDIQIEGVSSDYVKGQLFMHAIQSGHTSLEKGLLRIFKTLNEPTPQDVGGWHDAVVRQAFERVEGRVPILPTSLLESVNETRKFRNLAMHGYDQFDLSCSDKTLEAAELLATSLRGALRKFIAQIDPRVSTQDLSR